MSKRKLWIIEIRDVKEKGWECWDATTAAYLTRESARDHRNTWILQGCETRIRAYTPTADSKTLNLEGRG